MLMLLTTAAFAQVPSNATVYANLDDGTNWQWNHDPGTPGTSTGYFTTVSSPSLDGAAAQFSVYYSNYGGELYHLLFGNNTSATYFVYDTWVYLTDPSQVQNLELDTNQVLANGETIISATQCSSISGTWEYTYVAGGSMYGAPHWQPSNISCNPQNWAANKWHHIQIQTHRSDPDTVIHDWVKVDNQPQKAFKNAAAPSGLYLGWTIGALVLNFQVDGASANSGSIIGYFDKMQVSSW